MSFVFVSGNLALDFLGTLKWRDSAPEEFLNDPSDAAEWALGAAVFTAPPEVSDADLRKLIELRESVYRLVTAARTDQPWTAEDLRRVNDYADAPAPSFALSATGLRRSGNARTLGGEVARAAADLLARADEMVLRECGREQCTRVFIDRSRTGNRRWCDMEECGNRIKAAQYRARKAKPLEEASYL